MWKSCDALAERSTKGEGEALVSDAAPYAGRVSEWLPACARLDQGRDPASARSAFEAAFTPVEITASGAKSRFTGYFEPEYEASTARTSVYSEPIPALPADLVKQGGKPYQKLRTGQTRPYPARAQITAAGVTPLAYARPADVFFAQIQGSARFRLRNGQSFRAAYAANNGRPFVSTANWLMQRGWIERSEASMQGITAWMARAPSSQVREAMNANPRFVWFSREDIADAAQGPKGSAGLPLTALGSVAVDTGIHPLGVPMIVQTNAPSLGGNWTGLLIAQDTGGAIKGPVRGDIYFGTGKAAGERAGTMNAPGRMWVLLPKAVAARMNSVETRTVRPISSP